MIIMIIIAPVVTYEFLHMKNEKKIMIIYWTDLGWLKNIFVCLL